MNSKIYLLHLALILFCTNLIAQPAADLPLENILESIAENQSEDFDYTELFEILNKYHKNPINLNNTDKNQLRELAFLNPLQIQNLLEHIAVNGKLVDIHELQSIDGFDLEVIRLLLNFATINPYSGLQHISLKNLKKQGEHDLLIRYGRVLQEQNGFSIPSSSDKSRYLGSPDRTFVRYRFNFQNNIQFSLNLEKDAGEQFWNRYAHAKGPDFLSSSLYIKNVHRFKKIVIGDYALQFGQGLTLWSGLSFGKGADIFSVAKQDLGLRPYTSVNEFSFFRGLATQVNFGRFDFTPFISYRNLDASTTLVNAGMEIRSLQETGLHRTETEVNNKNSVSQLTYGGNLQYNKHGLSIGVTAYYSSYSNKFAAADELYNQFSFSGKQLLNTGLHYSKTLNNFYFFGEFAHSIGSGKAFINGAIASLTPQISLLIFHRNYQKDYHSFFNQAISENTNAVNEKGLYSGIQFKSGKKFDFSFYADMFKFPWLKFRVDAPSNGRELLSQCNYTPNKQTRFTFRYKFEEKEQNSLSGLSNALEANVKQNFRVEVQYQINKEIILRNRAEVVQFKRHHQSANYGFLAYQDLRYAPLNKKLSGNIRFALFDTDNFDTRIYAYENDVLYSFSIPGFQNKGTRFYINGRYKIRRGLDAWLKYSVTKYNDAETVGSGLDAINGNLRSEIKLQLRYQI